MRLSLGCRHTTTTTAAIHTARCRSDTGVAQRRLTRRVFTVCFRFDRRLRATRKDVTTSRRCADHYHCPVNTICRHSKGCMQYARRRRTPSAFLRRLSSSNRIDLVAVFRKTACSSVRFRHTTYHIVRTTAIVGSTVYTSLPQFHTGSTSLNRGMVKICHL